MFFKLKKGMNLTRKIPLFFQFLIFMVSILFSCLSLQAMDLEIPSPEEIVASLQTGCAVHDEKYLLNLQRLATLLLLQDNLYHMALEESDAYNRCDLANKEIYRFAGLRGEATSDKFCINFQFNTPEGVCLSLRCRDLLQAFRLGVEHQGLIDEFKSSDNQDIRYIGEFLQTKVDVTQFDAQRGDTLKSIIFESQKIWKFFCEFGFMLSGNQEAAYDKVLWLDSPYLQKKSFFLIQVSKLYFKYFEKIVQSGLSGTLQEIEDQNDKDFFKLRNLFMENYQKQREFYGALYQGALEEINRTIDDKRKKSRGSVRSLFVYKKRSDTLEIFPPLLYAMEGLQAVEHSPLVEPLETLEISPHAKESSKTSHKAKRHTKKKKGRSPKTFLRISEKNLMDAESRAEESEDTFSEVASSGLENTPSLSSSSTSPKESLASSLTYSGRVLRWFTSLPEDIPTFSEYHGISPDEWNQAMLYHGFARMVDAFVETLGIKDDWFNQTFEGMHDACWKIPGQIVYEDGQTDYGIFSYTIGAKDGRCYHRYFTQLSQAQLINDYIERGSWENVRGESPIDIQVPEEDLLSSEFSVARDGSYIDPSQETDYYYTVVDPLYRVTIRLYKYR